MKRSLDGDTKTPVLYINGLSHGQRRVREDLVLSSLWWQRYPIYQAHVDWLSDTSFEQHKADVMERATALLQASGRLVMVGASAGGSLAFNVFGELAGLEHNSGLHAVSLGGRLTVGNLSQFDYRTLERMARASQSFSDSVQYCETTTLPNLTDELKQRLRVITQRGDPVVPHQTMIVEGVHELQIPLPVPVHGSEIFMGGQLLPYIMRQQFGV